MKEKFKMKKKIKTGMKAPLINTNIRRIITQLVDIFEIFINGGFRDEEFERGNRFYEEGEINNMREMISESNQRSHKVKEYISNLIDPVMERIENNTVHGHPIENNMELIDFIFDPNTEDIIEANENRLINAIMSRYSNKNPNDMSYKQYNY